MKAQPATSQKRKKVRVVVVADAVVDPHAVVVHAQRAPVARRAVVRARRLGLRREAVLF
jgi:hypothetical protein